MNKIDGLGSLGDNFILNNELSNSVITGTVTSVEYLEAWQTEYKGTAVHFWLDDGSKWAIHGLHSYIFLQGTAKNKEVTITPMNDQESFVGNHGVLFNYWLTVKDFTGREHKEAVALLSAQVVE